MRACMYVCMYVDLRAGPYVYTCHMFVCAHVHKHMCMQISMPVCTSVRMHKCTCACLCAIHIFFSRTRMCLCSLPAHVPACMHVSI